MDLTEGARDLLRSLERPKGCVLRLELVGQRFRLVFDRPREDDDVLTDQEVDLLHLSPRVSRALQGIVLDRDDTASGPSIALRRPA
ncbi:MAG TPA: hypothetical protein VKY90_13740 [Candidatus Dormibacteraeota bacterium]|nr:hypothetical protein [Candidatus Dormibacteraeota bacterium]